MRHIRKVSILLLIVFLTACNLPRFDHDLISGSVTETPTTEADYTECAWNWNTRSLPDLSVEVQSAMETAGLTGVTVIAEAFGEDCITAAGVVDHFAAMETDFRITAQVASLDDREVLGTLLERILVVLDAFPPEDTPGPQSGYIGVLFQAGSEELRLWFPFSEGKSALALGLHGAALLDKLQNP